jgi:tRNA G37 N-methylase Trm5|tara:strand:+ start:129 stop:413 length:285 start_codon:yes stop_codon:yes gene_type:complete
LHLGRTLQETWTVNELVTQTAKAKCMNELNIKSKNEYIHRNIRINRCNDNCIPNLDTSFHLVPLADEINVGGNGVAAPTPPTNKAKNYETRQQR